MPAAPLNPPYYRDKAQAGIQVVSAMAAVVS
jgi:hypothetical protein